MSEIAQKLNDKMWEALFVLEPGRWPGDGPKFDTPEEAMAYAAKILHDARGLYYEFTHTPYTLSLVATERDRSVVEAAQSEMFILSTVKDGDPEENHRRADELVAAVLEWFGFRTLVGHYRGVGKWYS